MYQRILILLDDQVASQSAVKQGVEIARTHQAAVLFLYILPPPTVPMVDMPAGAMSAFSAQSIEKFEQQASDEASDALKAAEVVANEAGVASEKRMASGGVTAADVVDVAVSSRCELIVVASVGSNAVVRLLTGSLIPGLITKSSVPVMVCPQHDSAHAGKAHTA